MSGWASVFGTEWGVTLAITVILMGGCAFTTGQALASTWRPFWHAVPYALLLGCGDRFVVFALFKGDLFLLSGYVIDTIWLFGAIAFAFRVTRARQMVSQYPWLYERAGLLSWRAKA